MVTHKFSPVICILCFHSKRNSGFVLYCRLMVDLTSHYVHVHEVRRIFKIVDESNWTDLLDNGLSVCAWRIGLESWLLSLYLDFDLADKLQVPGYIKIFYPIMQFTSLHSNHGISFIMLSNVLIVVAMLVIC